MNAGDSRYQALYTALAIDPSIVFHEEHGGDIEIFLKDDSFPNVYWYSSGASKMRRVAPCYLRASNAQSDQVAFSVRYGGALFVAIVLFAIAGSVGGLLGKTVTWKAVHDVRWIVMAVALLACGVLLPMCLAFAWCKKVLKHIRFFRTAVASARC